MGEEDTNGYLPCWRIKHVFNVIDSISPFCIHLHQYMACSLVRCIDLSCVAFLRCLDIVSCHTKKNNEVTSSPFGPHVLVLPYPLSSEGDAEFFICHFLPYPSFICFILVFVILFYFFIPLFSFVSSSRRVTMFTGIPYLGRYTGPRCPGGSKSAKTGNSTAWQRSLRHGRLRRRHRYTFVQSEKRSARNSFLYRF